jgi:beta-phosphoglucomutase-like phosphatase (HAD superfamily)
MNKLIIFDLDGVLINSDLLHYRALNSALENLDPRFVISEEENFKIYRELNTDKKLELLEKNKGLPRDQFETVWKNKQKLTLEYIKQLPRDDKLIDICQRLKNLNYNISVATNSIRQSARLAMLHIGIIEYVDSWYTSQDVVYPKPYPEVYWKCMISQKSIPSNTIIIEDSSIGRQGVLNSGAHLCAVEGTWDVTWDKIFNKILEVEI